MSLFYAFFKNINDDHTERFIGVFATRDVADEWWRAVSNARDVKFRQSIKRHAPQFYTHDPSKANVFSTINDSGGAPQFSDHVFFTLMDDRHGRTLSIATPCSIKDRISGNTFYIRCAVKPDEFWWVPRSDQGEVVFSTRVTLSTTKRTLFRISRSNPGTLGTVMIGSDDVTIVDAASGVDIMVGNGRYLVAGGGL